MGDKLGPLAGLGDVAKAALGGRNGAGGDFKEDIAGVVLGEAATVSDGEEHVLGGVALNNKGVLLGDAWAVDVVLVAEGCA